MPRHAIFLTALSVSVLAWASADGIRHFCAVRRGIIAVTAAHDVEVATREAFPGDDNASRLGGGYSAPACRRRRGAGFSVFHSMWRSVQALAERRPLRAVLFVMIVRFALLAEILALAAMTGAAALLSTALGVIAGRVLVLRRVRRLPI